MTEELPKLLILSGPTASGKSELAIELASLLGAEILNADSMQVYRGMDIGTAKIPIPKRGGITHHLIDIVDPDQEFNAALFRSHALPIIDDLSRRDIPIIVVGGTGLYVKALLGGLFSCPPSQRELRQKLWEECEDKGSTYLYERLCNLDSKAAERIHPTDAIRIIRALEVLDLTGRPFSEVTDEHSFSDRRFLSLHLCLFVEREVLYDRINSRTLSMIDAGLVGEVEGLLRMGYGPELKPMKAIGYRHIVGYLKGDWDLDEVVRLIQRDTKRYAKRQITWFRADPEVVWVNPDDRSEIIHMVRAFRQ
ncbi:MAG: tRNA (adenosine(37)-N6)-dimethylallyltransferase MiaA [Deltaproteobacteria bacterium]|nr:tRNA (adenosine(37)-N6)-dimethylallyltransferase MiaA [Deltaproteobacteria bacterium]